MIKLKDILNESLQKGDKLKFKSSNETWILLYKKGEGFDIKISGQREKSWQKTAWLDMMIKNGNAVKL